MTVLMDRSLSLSTYKMHEMRYSSIQGSLMSPTFTSQQTQFWWFAGPTIPFHSLYRFSSFRIVNATKNYNSA